MSIISQRGVRVLILIFFPELNVEVKHRMQKHNILNRDQTQEYYNIPNYHKLFTMTTARASTMCRVLSGTGWLEGLESVFFSCPPSLSVLFILIRGDSTYLMNNRISRDNGELAGSRSSHLSPNYTSCSAMA